MLGYALLFIVVVCVFCVAAKDCAAGADASRAQKPDNEIALERLVAKAVEDALDKRARYEAMMREMEAYCRDRPRDGTGSGLEALMKKYEEVAARHGF